jgi:hypothetical protein
MDAVVEAVDMVVDERLRLDNLAEARKPVLVHRRMVVVVEYNMMVDNSCCYRDCNSRS